MSSVYAKDTDVSSERSRTEIETILTRYGATSFAYATNENKAMIQFQASERRVMFIVKIPGRSDPNIKHPILNGKLQEHRQNTELQMQQKIDKVARQRWRCLALAIKGRLESVASEIETFETAFHAHIVMPDGKTVGEHTKLSIEHAYSTGKMPPLLPHFKP